MASKLFPLMLLVAAPVALGYHYGLEECDNQGTKRPQGCICPEYTRSFVIDASAAGSEIYYIEVDEALSNNEILELWIYQESNGIADLQRHDEYCTDDISYDHLDADTILY